MLSLKKLRDNEPLRLYVYPALVILVGVGVSRGSVDLDLANVILGVVGLVLGIGATEAARAKVTPQGKLADAVAAGAQAAIGEAQGRVHDAFGDQGTLVLDQVSAAIEERIGRHRRPDQV